MAREKYYYIRLEFKGKKGLKKVKEIENELYQEGIYTLDTFNDDWISIDLFDEDNNPIN
tara:strand:- start:32 stop:208 length:177 start_codon:yes stop_codon:yes gene_type:complete